MATGLPWEGQDYVVQVWGTRQGLPQDAVRALAQTPDGYLWVGTFGGLARFDGNRFEVFGVGNTPALPDNLVNALFCDRKGRLWIGHDTGRVTVMEGRRFRRVSLPGDWARIPIRSFGEDSTGGIWVINTLWRLAIIAADGVGRSAPESEVNGQALHFQTSAADRSLRVVTHDGRCYVIGSTGILADPDGPPPPGDGKRVICSGRGGYWAVQKKQLGRWVAGREVEALGIVDWGEAIYAITCEWNGMVAAGAFRDGLSLAGRGGTRRHFGSEELPSNWIAALLPDREGTLWVGTGDGGLVGIWPKRVYVVKPPGEASIKHIQSVTPAREHGIWAATEGAGLFQFDGEEWRQAPDLPWLRVRVYSSLWMGEDGRLWASTPQGGLFYLLDRTWHVVSEVDRIVGARGALLAQRDALWLPSAHGLLRVSGRDLNQVEQVSGCEGICCLADDGGGGVWFGGYGIGLGHWSSQGTQLLRSADGLPSENILSLYRSGDGSLWIGTDGAGLLVLKYGRFGVISKRNGLPSESICQITEDGTGRLWLGTGGGICAVSLEDLEGCVAGKTQRVECLVLDTTDGMESQECSAGNQPSVCRTADGSLWFATRRGVAVVAPATVKARSAPPPVRIEQIRTDAGSFSPSGPGMPLLLPRGQRRLQIGFNAPCLRAAHRVRFQHRLDPIDAHWVESWDSREVTYASIPPGEYRFNVTACNEDGVWNQQGAAVSFVIPPFAWERAWFAPACWVGGLGAAAVLVLAFIRQRLNRRLELLEQQRAVERERSRIAKDLHDDLGGSLTEIGMLADAARAPIAAKRGSEDTLAQIGRKTTQLVRALDEIVWAVNPKHDSVASLADYLVGVAREFLAPAGIRMRLSLPRDLRAIPLSPEHRHEMFLAAKEALNNIVRHAKATEVWLRLELECRRLCIRIEDNGCGFDPDHVQNGGDGLVNMRERLADQGGECQIRSRIGAGTSVCFNLPIE